jgi:osmoprotectant transport system substrate-binding protein
MMFVTITSSNNSDKHEVEATEVVEPIPTKVAESIIVGSKQDTEQLLLGKMLVFALEEAGIQVEDRTGYGDTLAIRETLQADLYWELPSSALTTIHGLDIDLVPSEPDKAYRTAKNLDDEKTGLQWLERLGYNNAVTLVGSKDLVGEKGITTIQQLAEFMNANDSSLKLCSSAEFLANGLSHLQEKYGFTFKSNNIELMGSNQTYPALNEGQCDVAIGHTTDSHSAWGFESLQDTSGFFVFENSAPVISQAVLAEKPEVAAAVANFLADINPRLDETKMSQLNACVELGADKLPGSGDEIPVEDVARSFLNNERLACLSRPIRVSSAFENRNLWVGKLLQLLLKDKGYEVVDKTELGNPPEVRQAIENDEVDVYCEFLSRVLVSYYGLDPRALPTEPEGLFALAAGLDAKKGLIWPRISENVLYATLIVSDELYEQGIWSMTDLADLINADEAPLKLCTEPGFYEQADGIRGLEARYGFKFKEENIVFTEVQTYDTFPNYDALQEGICDVAHGRTTDDIELWSVQILEDPEFFFPPLIPGLLMREEITEEYPELANSLVCLNDYISSNALIDLNRRTWGPDGEPDTGDEESKETVGHVFLCEVGLISNDCPADIEVRTDVPVVDHEEADPEVIEEASAEVIEEASTEVIEEASAEVIEEASTEVIEEAAGQVCEELVLNGDFEGDADWPFPATSGKAEYSTDVAHSAERSLLIGYSTNDDKSGQSIGKQFISIPGDVESAKLSYWYYPISNDSQLNDVQGALILSGDESIVVRQLQRDLSNEQAWVRKEHDLSGLIGEDVVLYFYVDNNGDGQASAMYLDEVSVQVCSGAQ